jgi:hypothetical protein
MAQRKKSVDSDDDDRSRLGAHLSEAVRTTLIILAAIAVVTAVALVLSKVSPR